MQPHPHQKIAFNQLTVTVLLTNRQRTERQSKAEQRLTGECLGWSAGAGWRSRPTGPQDDRVSQDSPSARFSLSPRCGVQM